MNVEAGCMKSVLSFSARVCDDLFVWQWVPINEWFLHVLCS